MKRTEVLQAATDGFGQFGNGCPSRLRRRAVDV